MTDKTSHPTNKTSHPVRPSKQARPAKHVENSTDATRGEPLALRARKRKLELEQALERQPAEDVRARNDINVAVASINALLTGDVDHLSDATAAELSRLLENSKHLAEINPASGPRRSSSK
jgi:cell division septum initiation protein DivIVA